MEKFDALDINGNKLGFTVYRSFDIEEGIYYGIVSLIIINKGKILVTKRHPNKTCGLQWEVTGGGMIAGEDYIEASKRELFEETGLRVDKMILLDKAVNNQFYCYTSVVLVDTDKVRVQEEEVIEYKWLDKKEFIHFLETYDIVPQIKNRLLLLKEDILNYLD